ncbi:hypothetical protein IDG99_02055 [Pelagibacterales bacterium SAG-MED09]|nr:hypothetical protein [Pelagibacterales bacterium SAG-MED09]
MIKKISSIMLIIILTGCASIDIKDKIPKRKACTGEKNTLTDLICKK